MARRVPAAISTALLVAALVIASAIIVGLSMRRTPGSNVVAKDKSQVTITTADGIALAATFQSPVRNSLSPAIILLHEYGQDRHQWDPYLQTFIDQGFVVLSYDLRGFGDSRLTNIPASQDEHLNSLPNDLPAVIDYLRNLPAIDPQKISIIGASIGADVAYVASGSGLGLRHTVLLSPVVRGTTLDGHMIQNFSPQNILGIASSTEQADLTTFMNRAAEPKQTKIITAGSHGMALMQQPEVVTSIIAWLKR